MGVTKGSEAASVAEEFQPDIVLLDIIMPDVNGADVANQIKSNEKTENIPIIFVTAVLNKKEVEGKGGVIGGHPFAAKPISTQDIICCIEKTLGRM